MDESNKRRRTTTSNNNDDKHITDLPDGILVGISSYLAKPSAALFAMAMNLNNSQPTQTSNESYHQSIGVYWILVILKRV